MSQQNQRQKPPCYFCLVRGGQLRRLQFHVTVKGKPVLERHLVCEECAKKRLFMYH